MKPNVYLDIDGVLLANESYPALYAAEFIKHTVSNYPTYWLTTHCMLGNAEEPIDHIGKLFDEATVASMRQIRATSWVLMKTEAIDFSKPFIWFDDDLYSEEREELIKHGALDNWIEVDLYKNEKQLANFINSFPLASTPTTSL